MKVMLPAPGAIRWMCGEPAELVPFVKEASTISAAATALLVTVRV